MDADTNPLRLLGRASSINVRKLLWLLHETGLPFEHEPWGEGDRRLDDPAFLALNPNGQVPVLVHGDRVLWESNTLCRYLAGIAGRDDLLPVQPGPRAQVEQWMDWQATDLNSAWRYAFMALVRRHPDFTDPQAVQASASQWNRLMGLLDARLATTGAWVAGNGFTLADIVLGLSLNRWRMTPIGRPSLPHLERYHERLCEREGYRRFGANGQA